MGKTLRKGCFEEDEEGKASQFNLGEQTKVRKGNARMTMGGSKKREKEGLWLSWKEAIQQTTLEEEQLRDLMLSQYSYASIPYKNKRQVASAGELKNSSSCHCCRVQLSDLSKIQAGESEKPPQEKEQETPSLQKDRKAKTILQVQLPEVEVEKVKRTGTGKGGTLPLPLPSKSTSRATVCRQNVKH